MGRITGITTTKDTNGNITKVTIDVKKHGEIIAPLLQQLESAENKEFEKEWIEAKNNGSLIEDVFERLEAKIRSWEWQK